MYSESQSRSAMETCTDAYKELSEDSPSDSTHNSYGYNSANAGSFQEWNGSLGEDMADGHNITALLQAVEYEDPSPHPHSENMLGEEELDGSALAEEPRLDPLEEFSKQQGIPTALIGDMAHKCFIATNVYQQASNWVSLCRVSQLWNR